jgi:hypothetical protein
VVDDDEVPVDTGALLLSMDEVVFEVDVVISVAVVFDVAVVCVADMAVVDIAVVPLGVGSDIGSICIFTCISNDPNL